jgi:beta-phosphoglucomutase
MGSPRGTLVSRPAASVACDNRQGRFAAVCFDLDGVLIDTMPLHARAWQTALARRGLRVARQTIYAREGEPGAATACLLLTKPGHHAPSSREVTALLGEKERVFSRLARQVPVHPALRAALARLACRQTPMALVTGTSWREVRRAVPRDVLHRFTVVVTGDQVRCGKPHPEPYRMACRCLGIPARRVVVVENAPYGIASARGAHVGRILAVSTSLPTRYLTGADEILPRRRLPARLTRLLRAEPAARRVGHR